MSLLEKSLVFLLIGLATCSPFNNFDFSDPQTEQTNQIEQAFAKVQPMIESLQAQCKKANKTDIGENLENTFRDAVSCIQGKINPQELKQEFETAGRAGGINEMFRKMCTLWPQIHSCMNILISDSRQCLDTEGQHTFDKTIGLFDDSNNFFCENDHQRITDFLGNNGIQCINTVGSDIVNCVMPIMERQAGKDVEKIAYSTEDCSDFRELRTCVSSQTGKCESVVPGKIIDDYLALVQRVVCNSASSLTWFSTINVFLVLCTYLYSKMF